MKKDSLARASTARQTRFMKVPTKNRPRGLNLPAHSIFADVIDETPPEPDKRNPAAVALGALGASKGGKARSAKLSPKKRKEIAKKAAEARRQRKRRVI